VEDRDQDRDRVEDRDQDRDRDAALEAALDALSAPGRLRGAEERVARIAPQLQQILAAALQEGGWFDEAHQSQVLKAATTPDPDERIAAVRTLLAEETRMGMMVGVAVGWALAEELANPEEED
jgi:Lon protease-like protein